MIVHVHECLRDKNSNKGTLLNAYNDGDKLDSLLLNDTAPSINLIHEWNSAFAPDAAVIFVMLNGVLFR